MRLHHHHYWSFVVHGCRTHNPECLYPGLYLLRDEGGSIPCLRFLTPTDIYKQVQGWSISTPLPLSTFPDANSSTVTVYSITCQRRSSFGPGPSVKTQNSLPSYIFQLLLTEHCVYGDSKAPFDDGTTCDTKLAADPGLCYQESYNATCCRTCQQIRDQHSSGLTWP